jgi:phenylalanyl-tRNA synthetase beta chain
MRAPLSWLREYVGLPDGVSAEQVAADLVRVGLEEEAIHGGGVEGPLVVGRVLEFVEEPQKNGKTIRWCQVDVGNRDDADDTIPQGIVCGARNFEVGDLVVVSLPGAVLPVPGVPGGFRIAARKTYGHVSDGMICSAKELGLGDDHAGIIRLNLWGVEAEPGTDAIALLGLDEETVEVNVTPDRGYAFAVRGIAREYGLSTGAVFSDPANLEVPKPTDDGFAVRLDDASPINGNPGCDRYVARVVRGLDPTAPTPRWMQRRLEQAGMRPISLAVDVTNYVMLGLGQPLHAFDLAKLNAPVVVRRAAGGERLTTLDDVERILDPEDLLITDGGGQRLLALAGVMGGASSEVDEHTRDVLIEAAHFDPVTVARSARRHKLPTEASKRFERGVDTDLADAAAELAVRLLVQFGGGTPAEVTDVDERTASRPIRMPADLPGRVAGVAYTAQQIGETLTAIGCRVQADGPDLIVQAPSWRPDLTVGVDLVEEVARINGFDQIPSVLPQAPGGRGLTFSQRARRSVARGLAEYGLVEVLSYPFVSPSVHDAFGLDADDPRRRALRLANPLSDEQPEMRTSLLPPLLDTLRRNVARGATDVGLFEIGLVVRPENLGARAPQLPLGVRPSDEDLARLRAAVPPQPRRVAVVLAGQRELPGWNTPGRPADWTDALGAALDVAGTLRVALDVEADTSHAPWHPGRCARLTVARSRSGGPSDGVLAGHAGELHPKVIAALGLPPRTVAAELDLDVLIRAAEQAGPVTAAAVSTYPVAKEDVALIVDATVPASDVERALVDGAGTLLESVRLFDVFTGPQVGEGKKSLAFALRFRAADHTLTADETTAARTEAVRAAAERTGAVLRG